MVNDRLPRPRARPRRHGFTLVELVVVMAMVALLLTLAVPRYFGSLDKGRRTVQAQNVAAVRDAIDKYFGDNGRYPDSLSELVQKRYLRSMPVDPVTEQSDWVIVAPSDAALGGVYDIRSAAEGQDLPPRGTGAAVAPEQAAEPAPGSAELAAPVDGGKPRVELDGKVPMFGTGGNPTTPSAGIVGSGTGVRR